MGGEDGPRKTESVKLISEVPTLREVDCGKRDEGGNLGQERAPKLHLAELEISDISASHAFHGS